MFVLIPPGRQAPTDLEIEDELGWFRRLSDAMRVPDDVAREDPNFVARFRARFAFRFRIRLRAPVSRSAVSRADSRINSRSTLRATRPAWTTR